MAMYSSAGVMNSRKNITLITCVICIFVLLIIYSRKYEFQRKT